MKTNHTPGPWEWDRLQSTNAVVVHVEAGEIAEVFDDVTQSPEETEANARLIAAAPLLLAALATAHRHLEWCGYGDSYERECARDSGIPEQLEAALAAAKPPVKQPALD